MCRMLEGRVAVVTGSGRGIGRGIALKLASEGAKVVVNGTTRDAVEETVSLIRGEGNEAVGHVADVSRGPEVDALMQSAVSNFGKLDILVNNAGVNRDAMFEKMTEEQWDEVIDVNLKGPWLCCKYAGPLMRQNRYGRIITVGSEGAVFGNMGMVNYISAKTGLLGMTMTIARELGRWVRKDGDGSSLTCNIIFPGFNVTRMTDGVPEQLREHQLSQIVLGRVADSREDVGALVAFLASPSASYITGSKIACNGGLHMTLVG